MGGAARETVGQRAPTDAPTDTPTIDVTDEKRFEQALATSEARLREAQCIAHVGSWHWDIAADQVVWSDELYRIYGLTVETFTPTYEGYITHVHPADRELAADHLARTLEDGEPYDHEYRIIRADGEVRWLFTQAVVTRDPAGAPLAMHGSCLDVTDRHAAEAELAQLADHLIDAQAMAGLGSWAFDLDGERLRWSEEMFVLHGLPPDSEPLTMEQYLALVHPRDRDRIRKVGRAVAAGLDRYDFEYRIVVGGDTRWMHARGRPVTEDGRLVGLRGTVLDVTAQQQAQLALREAVDRERDAVERLRETDRLKDEFLSTASHELRTPLTALVGFASALARGLGGAAMRRQLVERIEHNALALGAMVERLLDFSQLEAGTVHLEPRRVRVRDAVEQVVDLLGADLSAHQVDVDVSDDLEIIADPAALSHVLSNLLANAARFAPTDTAIRVAAGPEADGVAIEVGDRGPGMSDEVAARVFDRFYRGPVQPDGHRGSGIGLSIVKSYVTLMGGHIELATAPGEGAKFKVRLPVADRSAV